MTQSPDALQPCPSAESLAAFVERRLSPEESNAVARHVAACDDCGTTFAEAASFLQGEPANEDEPTEEPPAEHIPRPRVRPRLLWVGAGLAASLLLGVAAAISVRQRTIGNSAPSPMAAAPASPASILISRRPATALVAFVQAPEAGAAPGFQPAPPAARRVRLGVALTGLEIVRAAGASAPPWLETALARTVATEAGLPWPPSPISTLIKLPVNLERDEDVAAGRLLEACRIASLAHDDVFLRAPETRAGLLAIARATSDQAVGRKLEQVLERLDSPTLDVVDLEGIAKDLKSVLLALT